MPPQWTQILRLQPCYNVQYSSTEDFIRHVSLTVPVTTNMIAIPVADMACFLRVSVNNSAGYGPFSDIAVTPTPVNSKQIQNIAT